MKNFEIDWYTDSKDEDYEQALLESNRRYQILVIEGINKKSQNLFKFITQQSSSLKHLEIYSSFLKLSDLIKIFKLVSKNLKIFALIDTIFEVDQDGPYDLENLQLDELKFGIGNDEFIKLYDLFQNILNLKKIIIHVYDINTREQQNVCNFIRNQNQMKEFEIIINDEQNNDGTTILKDLRNISSILQLTKLSITNSMEASNLYHIDTFVFLKQSFSSLKDLKISDTKFSASDFEVLLNMRLEELEIMYFRCLMTLPNTISVQNSSIKKLSVCHHLDKFENETQLLVEFLKNCLAVEYFKLHRIAMKYEIGLVLLYYMKNLKHLEVNYLGFPIHLPMIQTLYLNSTDYISLMFIRYNRHLKKLKVPRHLQNRPDFQNILDELKLEELSFYEDEDSDNEYFEETDIDEDEYDD